ncbi:MAG: DUF58 domain-containing protein [Burkholderiales bacterium]|nr:DUF58 domain-containing protein [Burkholderiales bacterium]
MAPTTAPPAVRPSFFDARGRWRAWWDARREPRESLTLTQRNIYIVPSRAGLMFGVVLVLLLVVAINYQLSLGFALTFLLAGSAAASMQMTHGSLRGLTLHLKPLVPAFDGDAAVLEVVVTNAGAARLGVGFGLDLGIRPIPLAYAEIPAQGQVSVHLGWLAPHRGLHALPVLRVESRYPFGLFRAWTIWRPAGQQWIYPRPELPTPPWPQVDAAQGDDRPAARTGAGTEFEGVRAYRRGDTLRQVVWKKAARTGELVSRETAGAVQRELVLRWQQAQGLDTEARVSRLAAWVLAADAAGHRWGLALPGAELAPDNGASHRHAALRALASV